MAAFSQDKLNINSRQIPPSITQGSAELFSFFFFLQVFPWMWRPPPGHILCPPCYPVSSRLQPYSRCVTPFAFSRGSLVGPCSTSAKRLEISRSMHASHEGCSPNFVHPLNMHMCLKMITARTPGDRCPWRYGLSLPFFGFVFFFLSQLCFIPHLTSLEVR